MYPYAQAIVIDNIVALRIYLEPQVYISVAVRVFNEADELYQDKLSKCLLQFEASASTINMEFNTCRSYS